MAVRPPSTQRTEFRTDSGIAGSIVRQIDTEFKELHGINTVLPALFGYGDAVYLSENYQHEWIRDEVLPHVVALSAPFAAATDNQLTLEDANLVMDGQLLAHQDQMFRITSHASSTVVNVVKAYAGSTAASMAAGAELHILPPDALDNEPFQEAVKGRGEIVYNTPMQIQEKWSQTDLASAKRSYLTRQSDELDFETQRKHLEIENQMESLLIFGRRVAPTNTTRGQFAGLRALITTHKVAVNGVFTPTILANQLEAMAILDEDSRGRTIIGNMKMKRVWDAVFEAKFDRRGDTDTTGVTLRVEKIDTNWGTYDFVVCRSMPDGELFILNPGDGKIRPVKTQSGSGWMEHEWDYKNLMYRGKAKGISNVLTFELKNEKRHAHFTGINVAPASYTGYV